MTTPPSSDPGRRSFLAGLGLTLAACQVQRNRPAAPVPATAPEGASSPAEPPPAGIDAAAVAAAEQLLGIELDPSERSQLLAPLEAQLRGALERRAEPSHRPRAPATEFRPLVPKAKRPPIQRFGSTRPGPGPRDELDLAFASLTQLGDWLRRREVSSVELTKLALERLDVDGRALEAVVELRPDAALAEAGAADAAFARGDDLGPLHGIPWGAKDLFDTKDLATTWGAAPFRARRPTKDAWVVERLRSEGAVLVAKLSTGALAYGDVWYGGRTRNPWNRAEGSSGSSAGPASATAAGLVPFALGTETLGSIVSPSMRCGVTGLRPTFSRISTEGCMALCWSLDKVGPLARFVADTARVAARLDSGRLPALRFDGSAAIKGRRVGYVPEAFEGPESNALERNALRQLEGLGVELVPVSLPRLPYDALLAVLYSEAASAFEDLTLDGRDDALTRQDNDAWPNLFRAARFISAVDYLGAQRLRREVMVAFDRLFVGLDAIVGPSFGGPMLVATNFTGHPSLTLPIGFEKRVAEDPIDAEDPDAKVAKKTPRGITLWAPVGCDGELCELGVALERELGVAGARVPT